MKRQFNWGTAWLGLVACVAALAINTAVNGAQTETATYPVRVALVSDVHITFGTKDDQPYRKERFEKAIDEVNAEKVDLVLMTGDLTENGYPEELRSYKSLISKFNAPVWYVPGNHDVGNKRIAGKKEMITDKRLSTYERVLGPSFWVKETKGVRVIGGNSGLMGSGLKKEKKMWEVLETAMDTTNSIPTVFMLHHPPFQSTNTEPGGVYWNLEPYPRGRLLGLLKQGGVKTVLSGHLHKSITNKYDGITFFTTTTAGCGDPKKKSERAWVLLEVSQKGTIAITQKPLR